MARPSKYTPARAAKIIEGLKAGMTRRAACGLAHIPYPTFFRWLQRYESFVTLIQEAENEAEAKYIAVIAESALKHRDPKTAMEWLKRRRREDWGDNLHVDINKEIFNLLGQVIPGDASAQE